DYRRPGFKISREVADAIAEHPEARALVLERHGTITWGAGLRDACEATIELITRAEEAMAEKKRGRRVFGGPRVPVLDPAARRAAALALAPRLRGRLGHDRRVIVTFDDADKVTEFASSLEAPALSQVGPATPDHTIYTRRVPCFVPLEGADVVVGDLDEAGAKKTAEEVTAAVGGGRAIGLPMDVTSETSVRAAFETTVLAYGGLDVLVSNAGIAHSAPVDRMALAVWER